mmetsp:Transcript_6925/g.25230  ORF Transcript_6925/g.25230 Transcript_6925/m.25230 type:complete len:271 (+) Transcript_6925:668-1480(+)
MLFKSSPAHSTLEECASAGFFVGVAPLVRFAGASDDKPSRNIFSSTSCVSGTNPCFSHTSPMRSTNPVKINISPTSSKKSGRTARMSMSPRCTLTKYKPFNPRKIATLESTTGDPRGMTAPTVKLSTSMLAAKSSSSPSLPRLRPPGNNTGAATSMYAMPLNSTGTPNLLSSNNPNARSSGYRSRRMPSTTKFVDVPINVHVPPRMLANDNGINNCAGEILHFLAHFCTIGIIIATTGVLFRNALTHAIGTINLNCASAALLGCPSALLI